MAGFGPVGSAPVASLGGSLSGTIITPLVGSVTVAGFTPTLTGTDPAQIASINREVLLDTPGTVISTTVVREVLRDPQTTSIFEYSVVREVLRDPEVIAVQAYSVVREVLRQGYPLTPQGGSISILW